MRRRVLVAAAVIALLVGVAVPFDLLKQARAVFARVTGIGQSVSLSAWRDDGPDTGAAVRRQAAQIYASFAGTAYQQDALRVIHVYQGNAAMNTCMAEAGHPEWDWSLNRSYADPEDPLQTSTWLAMPMSRWRSHDLRHAARRRIGAARVDVFWPSELCLGGKLVALPGRERADAVGRAEPRRARAELRLTERPSVTCSDRFPRRSSVGQPAAHEPRTRPERAIARLA